MLLTRETCPVQGYRNRKAKYRKSYTMQILIKSKLVYLHQYQSNRFPSLLSGGSVEVRSYLCTHISKSRVQGGGGKAMLKRNKSFSDSSVVKNLPANGFDLWSRRYPWEGNSNTLQYSCWDNPMEWGAWQSPWGCKELDMTKHACTQRDNHNEIF